MSLIQKPEELANAIRIQQQPEPPQQADDPNGPGWRDVLPGEILHVDDMVQRDNGWGKTRAAGIPAGSQRYRRRIKPQPSNSKPENAELKQLREQPNDKERYQRLLEAVFAEAAEYKAKWQSCIKLQADYRSGELTKQTTHEVQQLREKVETLSDMVQQLISRLTPTLRSREQE